ncbi:hypothetical protein [Leifsonia sp. NPDC058248]|uniref:ParB family protein n=1 Tax=Leifsonia sp. NPDC058248 TaxID=3346402 RepID=UPI0036DA3008
MSELGRVAVTFYIDDDLRRRAKAVYRNTCADERDASWSDMIAKALTTEVHRRERLYNRGRAFEGDAQRLTPGRPIG